MEKWSIKDRKEGKEFGRDEKAIVRGRVKSGLIMKERRWDKKKSEMNVHGDKKWEKMKRKERSNRIEKRRNRRKEKKKIKKREIMRERKNDFI